MELLPDYGRFPSCPSAVVIGDYGCQAILNAMSEDDIFEQTKDAYLCLIHPKRQDCVYRQEIAAAVALASSVPDELVAGTITNRGWRERLIGLCMGASKRPAIFVEPILQSLLDPRGIAIVPACAALGVFARRGIYKMPDSFRQMFICDAFDGEVGWAAHKAMHVAGLLANDIPGRGPNYGQIFDDHVEVYNWLLSNTTQNRQ